MSENKNSKMKLVALVLLLFVAIGVAGYGTYSYFYTNGSFSGSSDVSIASFDPQISESGDFLGHGGSITLSCPDSDDGDETITCTGSLDIYNNGGTDIIVSTSNESVDINTLSSDAVSVSTGTPTFSWSDTTIAPDSTETLSISVPVYLSSSFGDYYDSSYRSSEYTGEAIEVTVSFNITIEQAH